MQASKAAKAASELAALPTPDKADAKDLEKAKVCARDTYNVCVYVCACVHKFMHNIYIYIYIYTYIHTYIYICVYIHTHT
jgi:hypothetical protein